MVELRAVSIRYFSCFDEKYFFEWLQSIPCVVNVEGIGNTLYIDIDTTVIDDYMMRELLAIFMRYQIPMKQLIILNKDKKFSWFNKKEKRSYWYKKVWR